MKINLIKTLSGLKAADQEATDSLNKIKLNTVVSCEVKRTRNYEHHKKFFSLLNLVLQNTEKYDTIDQLLVEVKLRLGYVDTLIIDGNVCYTPKSISFAKMTQDTFNKFYSKTIDVILKHFLIGTNREELENAVLGYT
jgi:hypothetical protein